MGEVRSSERPNRHMDEFGFRFSTPDSDKVIEKVATPHRHPHLRRTRRSPKNLGSRHLAF
jgi:hypothetical protein